MRERYLVSDGAGSVSEAGHAPEPPLASGWLWLDIETPERAGDSLDSLVAPFRLDPIAVRDALEDDDLPKVDDFGHHLLVVLHGLDEQVVETYEVDCFVTETTLVTVHRSPSPAIDALWAGMLTNPSLGEGSVDVVLARLADVLSRRLLYVMEVFDDEMEKLISMALDADPALLQELMAVRVDLSNLRRAVRPQREALDVLRTSPSPVITDQGRRRFSDVFDVADRAARGLENARQELAATLDAYRGAEARKATDVTKVLTIYAAVMLPLTLVVGFFGMNFSNLPGLDMDSGWLLVSGLLVVIALLSLAVFFAAGWIRRPSPRGTTRVLGKGLIEAARAPVHIGTAAYQASTRQLRHRSRGGGSS